MQQPKDIERRMLYPNNVRQCIKQQGYTLQEIADEVGISRRTLTNYVAGTVPIPRNYLEKIAFTIGCDVQELLVSSSLQSKQPLLQTPELEPRQSTSSIILVSHTNTPFSFDHGIHEQLDNAESMINLSWEAWFASKPKQAARELNKLLPRLEQISRTATNTADTLRIQELMIRCHGLLGAICLDALENDTALFHYLHAHRLAVEIHDTNQAVTYLALAGDTLRRQGEKQQAISYMENARDQASHSNQTTQGHILQVLAYTYADTGNETAFEHTIREATDLLAFTGEAKDMARKEFVPFEIYEIRGKASRDLGKPLKALEYLDLAERSLKSKAVTPRWHALLDISRGQALCDTGDLTTGVELASRGFLVAYECNSPRQMNRVRKLLRKLEASSLKHERKVAELRELVYETYMKMDLEK